MGSQMSHKPTQGDPSKGRNTLAGGLKGSLFMCDIVSCRMTHIAFYFKVEISGIASLNNSVIAKKKVE